MHSKKTSIYMSAILVIASLNVSAQSERPAPNMTSQNKKIIHAVTQFASAIGCIEEAPTRNNIVVMSPLKNMDERESAAFAVTWVGDISCQGSPGTTLTHIAVVRIGAGDKFYVDATSSAPYADLKLPTHIEKVTGGANNTIVVDAIDYKDNDSHCCPTQRKRYILELQFDGKWKTKSVKKLKPVAL